MIINQIPLSDFNESVYLTAYIQTREPNRFEPEPTRPAVIICPGGAYMGIDDAEAEYLSCQFLAAGFQTFILSYSVGAPYARFPLPIYDLEKAIDHVRQNAGYYLITEGKIAVCGLSAGAHLASLVSTKFDAAILAFPILDLGIIDHFSRHANESTKAMVDMMFSTILGNTAPTFDTLAVYSSENFVTAQTPPTMIVHSSHDDWNTISQVKAYEKTCIENGVEVSVHTANSGVHGDYTGPWLNEAIKWIKHHL